MHDPEGARRVEGVAARGLGRRLLEDRRGRAGPDRRVGGAEPGVAAADHQHVGHVRRLPGDGVSMSPIEQLREARSRGGRGHGVAPSPRRGPARAGAAGRLVRRARRPRAARRACGGRPRRRRSGRCPRPRDRRPRVLETAFGLALLRRQQRSRGVAFDHPLRIARRRHASRSARPPRRRPGGAPARGSRGRGRHRRQRRNQRSPDSDTIASASRTARSAATGSPASVSAKASSSARYAAISPRCSSASAGAGPGHAVARLSVVAGHGHGARPGSRAG